MVRPELQTRICRERERGLTLVELIITIALLSILASAAVPVTLFTIKRDKEHVLRRDLWEMRDAIDHYKDVADSGAVQRLSTGPGDAGERDRNSWHEGEVSAPNSGGPYDR